MVIEFMVHSQYLVFQKMVIESCRCQPAANQKGLHFLQALENGAAPGRI